jgi:hypothetical protein
MRLNIVLNSANELLIALINRGYTVLRQISADYASSKGANTYQELQDNKRYEGYINAWATDVVAELQRIFPTELEANIFLNPEIPFGAVSGDYLYQSMMSNFRHHLRGLERIRQNSLPQYTDLPITDRLYIEDIDTFQKVRDVNPAMITSLLDNGYLKKSEDQVQLALEQVLGVSFPKKDSPVELNDLFTANVLVNGARRATAFLLKGP